MKQCSSQPERISSSGPALVKVYESHPALIETIYAVLDILIFVFQVIRISIWVSQDSGLGFKNTSVYASYGCVLIIDLHRTQHVVGPTMILTRD